MTRRVVELCCAAVLAILLAPVMAVSAVLVRLRLGRPVLFRQRRVGLGGTDFEIVKFRTMRAEAWPGEPDSERDHPLGRALRATSIDELPQLWNVLRGDMGFIGPRPTLPEQVVHYTERQRHRHDVRPGLTGWAQVNGRNAIPWSDRIELDLWYIEHRSLHLDLRIVALTALRLMRQGDIYGPGGVNVGFPRQRSPLELPARDHAEPAQTATAPTTAGKSST